MKNKTNKPVFVNGTKTKITVRLIGTDGNAFAIMGKVMRALKEAGYDKEFIERYQQEAMSGDYTNLLAVTMNYVNIEEATAEVVESLIQKFIREVPFGNLDEEDILNLKKIIEKHAE